MKELIAEAWSIGVDPDRIQACAGREDEEGLQAAVAERKHARTREVDEKVSAAINAQSDEHKDKLIAEQTVYLREANARLRAVLEA